MGEDVSYVIFITSALLMMTSCIFIFVAIVKMIVNQGVIHIVEKAKGTIMTWFSFALLGFVGLFATVFTIFS